MNGKFKIWKTNYGVWMLRRPSGRVHGFATFKQAVWFMRQFPWEVRQQGLDAPVYTTLHAGETVYSRADILAMYRA